MEPVVCTSIYIRREDSFDEPPLPPPPKKVEYLPFTYPGLTPFLKEKAERELGESEEKIKNGLAKLKELIAAGPIKYCTDDYFLMFFLRAKKYDVMKSFQQLKNYSEERYRNHDVFCNEKLLKYFTYVNPKLCGILPKRDAEGRAIMYFSANEIQGDEDPECVMGLIQVICYIALNFPATQVSGINIIADASIPSVESLQFFFRYLKTVSPKVHMFPVRFKRIDCVNANVFFQGAFNILKTILPSKMLNRVTLHGDQKESLLSVYPPEILPEEFGGNMGTLHDIHPMFQAELKKSLPIILEKNKYYHNLFNQSPI